MKVIALVDNILVKNCLMTISKALGVPIDTCTDFPSAASKLREQGPRNAMLFLQAQEPSLVETVCSHFPDVCIALLDSNNTFEQFIDLFTRFPQISYFSYDHTPEQCQGDLAIMMKKLLKKDIFGLEKYLGYGSITYRHTIHNKEDKQNALKSLFNFIVSIAPVNQESRFQEYALKCEESLDELILNGIFHGNPRLQDQDMHVAFTLSANEAIDVTWGYDGNTFAMAVIDPFGQLEQTTILKHIGTKETIHVDRPKGCVSGIQSVFHKSHRIIVNVDPGTKTEFICLRNFMIVGREKRSRVEAFHYFQTEAS